MGWNIFWREILNSKFYRVLTLILITLFLGVWLQASENFEVFPAFFEEQINYSDEFSRPLRTRDDLKTDHPAERNMLPPFYTEGKIDYYENQIITEAALNHPQTQTYIRHYTSPGGKAFLTSTMQRGGPYLAFIRTEIGRMNLPPELIYLPVIESSYVSTAYSRSGASGLWQFMDNSMGPFDMRVTDWMDERRDFWKSTQGGLRKLEENFVFFDDWSLALAAYNAGLGGVNRMIRESGLDDYWALRERGILAVETANYVPRLAAVSYVLSNQRRYELDISWPEDPRWQRIPVNRSVDLNILAEHAGIDSEELIWANRELIHYITPPETGYYLKVSYENAESVMTVLSRNDLPLVRHYIHTISSGDTLSVLAVHYGVSVDQILSANPGVEERFLRIGSRLVIPALRDVGPYTRTASLANTDFSGSHLVKHGETLWSIALAYGLTPEVLAEANGMNISDILREGRVLRTPIR